MINGKKHTLYNPCSNCPFTHPKMLWLKKQRRESIVEGLQGDIETIEPFQCHKTNETNAQHCAGAIISLLKAGITNVWMILAKVCIDWDGNRYDINNPRVHTLEEFAGMDEDSQHEQLEELE